MKKIKRIFLIVLTVTLSVGLFVGCSTIRNQSKPGEKVTLQVNEQWIGAWASAMQSPHPEGLSREGFNNQTIRMVINPSASGRAIRLHFSNHYGTKPLMLQDISIATTGSELNTIKGPAQKVTFNGNTSVVIPVGKKIFSDPLSFPVTEGYNYTVSVYVPESTGPATWHALSNQTTFYSDKGNQTFNAAGTSFANTIASWFWLRGMDVLTDDQNARIIVTFGDSITDGNGSSQDMNHRYPDFLSAALYESFPDSEITILNAGISGNRITADHPYMGEDAVARIDRDALSQTGVTDIILLEGINDIAFRPHVEAEKIIDGMKELAAIAHGKGVKIYVSTLLPYWGGRWHQYNWTYTDKGEQTRQEVNEWILTNDVFDGAIDLNKVMTDPTDPLKINTKYHSGDNVHPNDIGYQVMGETIAEMILKQYK